MTPSQRNMDMLKALMDTMARNHRAIGGLAVSALVMRLIFFLCEHTLFHELAPAFAVITTAAIMWPIAMLMNKLDAIRLRL